jgi:hypothetical protein
MGVEDTLSHLGSKIHPDKNYIVHAAKVLPSANKKADIIHLVKGHEVSNLVHTHMKNRSFRINIEELHKEI